MLITLQVFKKERDGYTMTVCIGEKAIEVRYTPVASLTDAFKVKCGAKWEDETELYAYMKCLQLMKDKIYDFRKQNMKGRY